MTEIPQVDISNPTLEEAEQQLVINHTDQLRAYMGESGWGAECERQLAYDFFWATQKRFPASTLMRFEDGHRTEDLVISRLKAVKGLDLRDVSPDGSQWGVSELNGHVRGHLDGAVLGLKEAPKTWHVLEIKCVSDKKFRQLERLKLKGEKEALESWSKTYFCQAQGYMGGTGMKRHYLVVASAGGRQWQSIRTNFQPKVYKALLAKAKGIIESTDLPPRISEDPEFFMCKWCNFSDQCHQGKTSNVNCRTCAHSTPIMDPSAGVPVDNRKNPMR